MILRKRLLFSFLFPLIPLLAASLACVALSRFQPSGVVLLRDDFSDPQSGWKRVSDRSGMTDYADGVYRILVNEAHMDIWSRPNLEFADVQIDVDAIKVDGDRNNRFGVLCRMQDDHHFYSFIISSDGYYGIGKVSPESYELLNANALQPSESINQGTALNHLRVDCVGDRLSLYVNGELLAQVRDSAYSHGDIGLFAGTYAISGTDIRFDNLVVVKP